MKIRFSNMVYKSMKNTTSIWWLLMPELKRYWNGQILHIGLRGWNMIFDFRNINNMQNFVDALQYPKIDIMKKENIKIMWRISILLWIPVTLVVFPLYLFTGWIYTGKYVWAIKYVNKNKLKKIHYNWTKNIFQNNP